MNIVSGNVLSFWYTNWKDRRALRTCIVEGFSVQEFKILGQGNRDPNQRELYLNGYDLDKKSRRSYHVDGIEQNSLQVIASDISDPTLFPFNNAEEFVRRLIDGCSPESGCGIQKGSL